MSLKVVSRKGSPFLYLRGTLFRKTVFESTGIGDRNVAEQIRIKREAEITDEYLHGKRNTRTFADAATKYLTAEPRTPATANTVRKLLLHFRTTPLRDISQESLDEAYLAILRDGVRASPATKIRGVIAPLQAVMEYAAVLGWCARPAFKKPKVPKTSTAFLLPIQADALIDAAAPHLRPLLTFLIGTGCRLLEALKLDWDRVDLHGARARVWQKQGNERLVDLPPRVVTALMAIPYEGERREGAVFRPVLSRALPGRERAKHGKRGKQIGNRYRTNVEQGGGQIKRGWAVACRRAGLPGQWREWIPKGSDKPLRRWVSELTVHDCRHTWASAHYAMHRDILKLKHEGGWSTTAMVERYTHLMPAIYGPEWAAWLAG